MTQTQAGGACVTPDRIIGYSKFELEYVGATGKITNWHGTEVLGTATIRAMWRTPRSFVSSWMFSIEVKTPDGKLWIGRTAGNGMCVNLRPKKGTR